MHKLLLFRPFSCASVIVQFFFYINHHEYNELTLWHLIQTVRAYVRGREERKRVGFQYSTDDFIDADEMHSTTN